LVFEAQNQVLALPRGVFIAALIVFPQTPDFILKPLRFVINALDGER
jgi:hypothetical protein